MEVDSEPSTQCNASRIFEGYKALGLIAGDKPFIVRYIDKLEDVRIVIIVGNYFHTYNSKLQLIETSHPHPGPVNALASDSKSVFSCSENKIYAWSGGRRNLYQVFEGHESRIHSLLAFGPHLISVDDSNVFRVWEISTAETVLEIPFGDGFTITCLLHPSTYINKILFGSKQGSLQLRNIRTQKLIHTFKGWNSKVTAIEQAPAVDVVGIGLEDGVIVVHNLKYDETLMTFIQDWGPVLNISFRTDGPPHMVTSSDKGHVAIWDLEKRKLFVQKRDIHQAKVTGCQYIFGESLLLTSSPDNSLKMWCFDDPEEIGRTLHCREGHTHPSTFIRFYGSVGQNILSVSSDSTFRMFSVYSERLHRSLGKASFNRKYAKKVGVANDPNVMPPIVEFAAESIREDDWDNVIARHADLARTTTWTTKKMRMGSHKLLHERFKNTKDIMCTALAISSCGNFVILGYNTGHIDRFNIQSGIVRASYAKTNAKAHEGSVSGIVCDETCRLLVSGGKDGIINFWVFKTSELLTELKVDIPINRFMLHKESSILAVAFDDHTIQVLDLDTRKCIRKLPDHKTSITDMTISYDARWLIVSTADCSIRVWDISLIKLIDWFLMPSPCKSLTMSPTGDYLAIALENDLGIFLYFNLSLYLPVSLKPISDSYIPRLNKLPSVRKEEPEEKEDNNDKDEDEADDVINVDETETIDIDMLDLDYKSPEQISSNLITLSSLPTSRWKNLLNLDLIKQRNKPVEPIEKPKSAPFFLPTIDGLEPDFDLTQTETEDQGKKNQSKVLNNLLGVSPFGKLLLNCAHINNFSPIIKQLKEMSPNTIDSEIRALDAMVLNDEDIVSDDHTLLASFLMAMESALETRKDYELIQSILGLFLKIYSPIILKDHNLVKQCENLCELVKKLPNSLQDQFNESLFIINFIRGTGGQRSGRIPLLFIDSLLKLNLFYLNLRYTTGGAIHTMLITQCRTALNDPYKILGVQRNAPSNEIKRAYKKLVRLWHPDKNKDPDAEDRFVQISKAYELLMDPERREEFNRFGTTEDTPNFRHKRDYSDFKRFDFDPFESIFSGGSSSSSNFNSNNQAFIFHRQTISAKAYQNKILPASITSPQLILFYGDLCFPCFNVEPVWHKIVLELEPLGVGFATIHSKHESNLARKIGIDDLPYIIGIVDGVVRHYKENQLSLLRIIEFIRKILPRHLITQVNDENYEDFLSGWSDNRVRVLFVNNEKLIKLRYLLTAFSFRERVVCGHVYIKEKDSLKIIQRYGVDTKMDSMLIFNEDMNRPIATLAASELLPQIIKDVLHANKYLLLPRLTSQVMFDQICPPDAPRSRRRLCVMLVTNNIPSQESEKEAMRRFILENEFSEDKFRFMYIYQEKQMDFINSLSIGSGSPSDLTSHVVVVWRREHDRLLYEWLPDIWDVSDSEKLNKSKAELYDMLNKLSKTTQTMTNNAKMVNLIDEHASGLLGRILKRILVLTDGLGDSISQKEVLPILSAVATFVFIGIFGYILQYLVKLEEKNIREQYRRLGRTPPGSNPRNEHKLSIHELRGETYNGLIRLLKPGCRTLVLLCDTRTKSKLLPKFYRCVHPYRKNKTLMFAYLLIEKNIEWYKKILQQSLGDHRELNINPKNCIGTVLSINGFKRYFCVYHVKHSEHRRAEHQDFLGFEDEEDDIEAGNLIAQRSDSNSVENQEFVFENNLLDALPQWLEKLFEGTTHRYFIQYWPDNMK